MLDLAQRVHDHNWKIDPIVRSLMDTDFYKLLMAQSVRKHHRDVEVTFAVHNRSAAVPLARLIGEGDLRAQLDHARSLKLRRGESTWLRGNTFYGKRAMFSAGFMDWLEGFSLPEYELRRTGDQYELRFAGPWADVMLWEVPALAILTELRSRAILRGLGKFDLKVLYARSMARVWEKIQRLQGIADLRIADFGTRRRHSFLWQDWCVEAMAEGLGSRFTGTSNCLLALRHDLEAIGTNAHELPMVTAALAGDDAALAAAPYAVLKDWMEDYDNNLRVILPDTFGSATFLDRAPDWLDTWTGIRIDSGDPVVAGERALAWWRARGQNPQDKRLIFSDGLDIDQIEALHRHFAGRTQVSFGWGTFLTNDFRSLHPGLGPFSLVCKAVSANGRPTVKLSDNSGKALGPRAEIDRYRRVFDLREQVKTPIEV
jgi:nicotinate phosphoribosyltransferase